MKEIGTIHHIAEKNLNWAMIFINLNLTFLKIYRTGTVPYSTVPDGRF